MSEEIVRKWYRDLKNERTKVRDKEWSGRPSKQSDEIVSQVDGKLLSDGQLTISALLILDAPLSTQLLWISHNVCKLITENAHRQREKNI